MEETATESRRSLKGKCPACGKMVSKSNMEKHRKVCGKTKPPKTCMVINRESYTRHKDNILNKRFEQRLYDRFRRLEDAEYDRERHRIRRARHEKAEGQDTFALLQYKLRMYRKRVEKHLASVALHAANFQTRPEKAQAA
ncbi:hypothetical protein Pcac1_g13388 [Phytophthora cactorum]|nr:hypothetical protein Pcac1_g16735 [Phytophthora cactorum]KAG2776060.1 hypothetical protein Pcac1_g13388 [Phytophthora cactorum]